MRKLIRFLGYKVSCAQIIRLVNIDGKIEFIVDSKKYWAEIQRIQFYKFLIIEILFPFQKFLLVLAFAVAAVSADVSHLRKYLPPVQDVGSVS